MLTGAPGAGKTTILTALSDALSDDDIPHASVEAEALRWAHPALGDEREMQHVRVMCVLYREAGYGLLLMARTVESNEDLARLLDAVSAADHFVVRLEAHPDTLVERIIAREPQSWSGLGGLLEHARQVAGTTRALSAVQLVLSTEGQRPEAVAERIRMACPDQLRARE